MNIIEYIREEKFGKFFNENKGNRLLFYRNGLDCEHINPFIWLLKNKEEYRKQILGAVCHSGKSLWDQTFYEYKCSFLSDLNKTLCEGQNDGQSFDIVKEFTRLSNILGQNKKNMKLLEIVNTSMEILPENAFKDLTFESIMILEAKNLSVIHRNAFSEVLASNLINTFMIESPTNLVNIPPDYNFFEALNSLKNVDIIQISLKPSSVQQIPSYAFDKTMFNLRQLMFNAIPISGDSFYTISRIESNSFSGLSKVRLISFRHIFIENIFSKAFEIYETSYERLTIDLVDCSLNDQLSTHCLRMPSKT